VTERADGSMIARVSRFTDGWPLAADRKNAAPMR